MEVERRKRTSNYCIAILTRTERTNPFLQRVCLIRLFIYMLGGRWIPILLVPPCRLQIEFVNRVTRYSLKHFHITPATGGAALCEQSSSQKGIRRRCCWRTNFWGTFALDRLTWALINHQNTRRAHWSWIWMAKNGWRKIRLNRMETDERTTTSFCSNQRLGDDWFTRSLPSCPLVLVSHFTCRWKL